MTTDKSTLLQAIGEAANGLLFPSESDFPIEPFDYGDQKPTPAGLLEKLGKEASTYVEEMTLAALFEGSRVRLMMRRITKKPQLLVLRTCFGCSSRI
jgi:hypothetical protein